MTKASCNDEYDSIILMDAKLKHLEFIQGVINRLATASFRMKGWAVVLVSALLFFLARGGESESSWIAIFPVLIFWGLDGYFLQQEREFRSLYDYVRNLDEGKIDFSMNTNTVKKSWFRAVFSISLSPFYIMLALTFLFIAAVNNN